MRVIWIRGGEHISFNKPRSWFVLGVRGSGKSSFLENLGELHLEEGHAVLDLFGSRDGESLAWLRSPYTEDKRLLLIHGDNADVDAPCDTRPISKTRISDFDDYDILISSSPLYSSPSDEFLHVARLTDMLYKRLSWRRLVYVIVREAANLYYSRLKVNPNQTGAKADMVYLIREARHMGIAMGLDTLKFTSIDLDVRAVTDYMIFKSQGMMGFPDDLNWLYGFIEPHVARNIPPGNFILLSRGGSIGLGAFPEVPWHKQEKEDILRAVGVRVEHGEELHYGEDKGTYRTVGDLEHVEIMESYAENHSMSSIAKSKGRSTATIHQHINAHNEAVERSGFCAVCRRAGGTLYRTRVIRGMHEETAIKGGMHEG